VKTVEPGLHYVNPCTDKMEMIDVKINVMDLERQVPQSSTQIIITKDNVSINIDASVYYRVINSRYAHYRVQGYTRAIAEITYAILKNTCGQFVLQDLLEKRQEIADDIEKQVDQYTDEWGINVTR
jgi:erythrocyte band 7 integral membrane protein